MKRTIITLLLSFSFLFMSPCLAQDGGGASHSAFEVGIHMPNKLAFNAQAPCRVCLKDLTGTYRIGRFQSRVPQSPPVKRLLARDLDITLAINLDKVTATSMKEVSAAKKANYQANYQAIHPANYQAKGNTKDIQKLSVAKLSPRPNPDDKKKDLPNWAWWLIAFGGIALPFVAVGVAFAIK